MIRLDRLCKSYAGAVALRDLTFEVARGEVVGLLGPNGAGKTTCLRVISCFAPPTSGNVWVDGISVRQDSRRVRERLGYLPEGVPLRSELRVNEHLRIAAGMRGLGRGQALREVGQVLERCGLASVRRQVVGTLSRGFRQRVGLATALVGDPRVLVLDEPTVGLDPNQLRDMRELIRELSDAHTVLLSTHQLGEVEAICSRAVIIDNGRLVAAGAVSSLLGDGGGGSVAAVRAEPEPLRAALDKVGEVEAVDVLDRSDGVLRVRLRGVDSDAARERVAAALAADHLPLSELRPAAASLERVFHDITSRGAAAGQAPVDTASADGAPGIAPEHAAAVCGPGCRDPTDRRCRSA